MLRVVIPHRVHNRTFRVGLVLAKNMWGREAVKTCNDKFELEHAGGGLQPVLRFLVTFRGPHRITVDFNSC